jgi:hypothetical protein
VRCWTKRKNQKSKISMKSHLEPSKTWHMCHITSSDTWERWKPVLRHCKTSQKHAAHLTMCDSASCLGFRAKTQSNWQIPLLWSPKDAIEHKRVKMLYGRSLSDSIATIFDWHFGFLTSTNWSPMMETFFLTSLGSSLLLPPLAVSNATTLFPEHYVRLYSLEERQGCLCSMSTVSSVLIATTGILWRFEWADLPIVKAFMNWSSFQRMRLFWRKKVIINQIRFDNFSSN